ncbi:MAG: CinA family protein [Opitutaceae bacterium]|nr:CinA family protein [Cytophagales bacterium]
MELNRKVSQVIKMLSANNLKIAFAESVTGGYLSYQYSIAEGSNAVYLGSMVCYNPIIKQKLLQVDPKLIEQFTAESKEVTEKMLDGLMHIIHPDIGVAVTGLCSPGSSETQSKPVGTVFFAISYNLETFHYRFENSGSPEKIVHQTVEEISEALIDILSPVNA